MQANALALSYWPDSQGRDGSMDCMCRNVDGASTKEGDAYTGFAVLNHGATSLGISVLAVPAWPGAVFNHTASLRSPRPARAGQAAFARVHDRSDVDTVQTAGRGAAEGPGARLAAARKPVYWSILYKVLSTRPRDHSPRRESTLQARELTRTVWAAEKPTPPHIW